MFISKDLSNSNLFLNYLGSNDTKRVHHSGIRNTRKNRNTKREHLFRTISLKNIQIYLFNFSQKDRDEFNQCQNQLKNLYNLVLKSNSGSSPKSNAETNSAEFIGYRLIYNMLTKSYKGLFFFIKIICISRKNSNLKLF